MGTWNTDEVLERATVHSSSLVGVQTRDGDCFWRTSHLVRWVPQANWVESGLFRCGGGPYKIFVYIAWGEGSPGYVIPAFDVPEGATVTTFAEWECVGKATRVSGGYLNEKGRKIYLSRLYKTGETPCAKSTQTDNNGEAYSAYETNFLVDQYTASNTQICDKDTGRKWLCRLWDTTFNTVTQENLETYDVHVVNKYYEWFGHGHPQ